MRSSRPRCGGVVWSGRDGSIRRGGGGSVARAHAPAHGGYGIVALALAIFGAGLGLGLPLAADAVLGTLAPHQTGMGNALSRTLQSVGVVLGTAILGSVLNSTYRNELTGHLGPLPPAARTAATASIAGAHSVAARLWGLRLHLVCTLHGLPVGFALAGAKADERQVLLGILADPALTAGHTGQTIIGDKNYFGASFEATLADGRMCLLRPARKGEPARPGAQFFKPLRQIIESVNDTLKGQLDLERHGGRTLAGVMARVLQRILALTAVIWHNDRTGQLVKRSLLADDH